MDHLGSVRVVAFDKTGTLTEGSPVVTGLYTVEGADPREVLAASAAAESLSEHPLAQAIVRKAQAEGLAIGGAEELRALPGWGIEAKVSGATWRIGKADDGDPMLPGPLVEQLRRWIAEGYTVSVIQRDGACVGLIALRDEVRPQAKAAIARLHELGVAVAMLTGDRSVTAHALAKEIGVDLVYADLLPQEKVAHVKALRERYGSVAMVGDGVNDAPALAAASVGIAMGGGGSGAALEVADVVLMNDSIERIAETISLARRARRIVKQNLVFAGAVILMLIVSNFAEGIPLPFGVVGHEGSTLLVILNGLRLLR